MSSTSLIKLRLQPAAKAHIIEEEISTSTQGLIMPSSSQYIPSDDLPIDACCKDILDRSQFARNVANTIRKWDGKDGSLTIGIEGPWGCGKSSLMNMIIEFLPVDDNDCICSYNTNQPFNHYDIKTFKNYNKPSKCKNIVDIIHFNPWALYQNENITDRFFNTLIYHTRSFSNFNSKIIKSIMNLSKLFSRNEINNNETTLIQVVTLILPIIVSTIITQKIDDIKSFFPYISSEIQKFTFTSLMIAIFTYALYIILKIVSNKIITILKPPSDIYRLKKFISNEFSKLPYKTLVIIDDIDRLDSEDIRKTLTLIKSQADLPNIIYVILYEQKNILNALNQYGENSSNYLDKIIQFQITVPKLDSASIKKHISNGIDKIVSHLKNHDIEIKLDKTILCYYENLRSANRLLNTISFTATELTTGGYLEVSINDLIAIETIKLFEQDVYNYIKNNGPSVLKHDKFDETTEHITSISNNKEKIQGIYKYIVSRHNIISEHKRLTDHNSFDKYFTLNIKNNILTNKEIESIILSADRGQFELEKKLNNYTLQIAISQILENKTMLKKLINDNITLNMSKYLISSISSVDKKSTPESLELLIHILLITKDEELFFKIIEYAIPSLSNENTLYLLEHSTNKFNTPQIYNMISKKIEDDSTKLPTTSTLSKAQFKLWEITDSDSLKKYNSKQLKKDNYYLFKFSQIIQMFDHPTNQYFFKNYFTPESINNWISSISNIENENSNAIKATIAAAQSYIESSTLPTNPL